MISEAGHYVNFIDLAKEYLSTEYVKKRWAEWLEIEAQVLLKATKVDGVYSEDPEKNPHAMLYSESGELPEVLRASDRVVVLRERRQVAELDARGSSPAAKAFAPYIAEGYTIVAPVPSCALMLKFEWPLILPEDEDVKRLSAATRDLSEYIVDIAQKEGLTEGLQPIDGGVAFHVSCHSRAQNIGQKGAELLRLVPGTYNVRAELQGFRPAEVRGVVVNSDLNARADFKPRVTDIHSLSEYAANDKKELAGESPTTVIADLPAAIRTAAQKVGLSSSMGPGLKIDMAEVHSA